MPRGLTSRHGGADTPVFGVVANACAGRPQPGSVLHNAPPSSAQHSPRLPAAQHSLRLPAAQHSPRLPAGQHSLRPTSGQHSPRLPAAQHSLRPTAAQHRITPCSAEHSLPATAWALLALILLPAVSPAAIWPEQWWEYKRTSLNMITPDDAMVWKEFGLKEAERATYDDGKVKFTASAWRLSDSTAAMAVFQWQHPAGWRKSKLTDLALENGQNAYFTFGNYVILLEGHIPDEEKRQILFVQLPRLERAPLPILSSYLPSEGLAANSERYVIGPVSLEKFEPRVPPSIAAFHMGAEAQIGRYTTPDGTATMAIFSYPTPAIAKKQVIEFQKLNGVMAKRTGPMVALLIGAANPDAAERLLAKVNYQASISWDETSKSSGPNMGDVILTAFKFAGFLILLTLGLGALIAGVKFFGRRYLGWEREDEAMLTLHIDDHRR
ncbi:MAG: DUF6599 family protein [Acidobacteriota bacterium]